MASAMKVRGGWIAPLEEMLEFEVGGARPTGLYIHGSAAAVWLSYAKTGGAGFDLPPDREALLILSDAIRGFANDRDFFPNA